MWALIFPFIFAAGLLVILFRDVRSYRSAADEEEKAAMLKGMHISISRLAASVICLYMLQSLPTYFSVPVDSFSETWWQTFLSRIAQWITAVLVSAFVVIFTAVISTKGTDVFWNLFDPPPTGEVAVVLPNGRDFQNALFKYKPLSQGRREIRILRLPQRETYHHLLGDSSLIDEAFHSDYYRHYYCTMETVSLDEKPLFQALSYAWGSAAPTCKIMVNNQPFWIASNLASAIHHLTANGAMTLWIDAICINQKDNKEKSWQVQQMRHVYEWAESVVIWLGERTMENISGFGTLRELNRLWDLEKKAGGPNATFPETAALRKLEWEVFGPAGPPPTSRRQKRKLIDSISALFSATWWGRIWVTQELAVASSVNFACGYDKIKSECFSDFLDAWDRLGGISRLLDHRPWAHFEVRSRFQAGKPLPIKDILQISAKAQLQATEPKDQVFALSALAGDVEEAGIKVDYSQSHITVFTDLAKSLIAESRDLWQLSFCKFSPDSLLPSWVPDWSSQPGLMPILQAGGGYHTGASSPFHASRALEPAFSVVDRNPPILRCKGIQVDVISRVGVERPMGRYNHLDDKVRNEVLTWFRNELPSLLVPASNKSPDFSVAYTPEERNEAPFRTLVLNQWEGLAGKWIPAPAYVEQIYETLVSASNSIEEQRNLSKAGELTEQFFQYAMRNTISKVPFVTKRGYLGLSSPHVKMGDVLVILGGGDVPYVLRAVEGNAGTQRYQLVGEAYVHGIMSGEVVAAQHETQSFDIM